MNLEYLASFGDHVPLSQFKQDDTISILSFSKNGQFLASGDQAGRVVVFQVNTSPNGAAKPSVSFVVQVHAHKSSFDYFRSELSDPKINGLKWVNTETINPLLLTCNSHDAKLWRFVQNTRHAYNPLDLSKPLDDFVFPQTRQVDVKYTFENVKTYTDIQTEYLVDLLALSDQRSFLLVDIGCVKLWDMERDIPSVNLYKVPNNNVEIVSSAVTDTMPTAVLIGDDSGSASIIDMRQQSEDLTTSIFFDVKNYLSSQRRLPSSTTVSSVAFSQDGMNLVVRTFGDAQVWDIRQPSAPLSTCEIQWFPGQMDTIINEEFIKDQFRTSFTSSGKVVTGNYSADFMSWDWNTGLTRKHRAISARTPRAPPEAGRDFTKRVTVCESHPKQDIVAVVSTASLFLFNGKKEPTNTKQ